MPLNAFGAPSMMAIGSPRLRRAATASPTSLAPLRLSGPTNGIASRRSASTPASKRLSMLTTAMPACAARWATATSARESAGASDERLHVARDHLLDDLDLPGDVLLVLDAGGHQLVRVGVCCLVRARAVLHRLEELVGERLHHERDDRFGRHRGRAIAGDGAQAERQRERGAAGTGHRPMLCGPAE